MNFLLIITLALGPALFWMWWYYRKDVYDKEPMRLLALVFILATPLSVLCGILEYTIDGNGQAQFSQNSGLFWATVFYFGVVGVIEELAKFFVVITLVYRRKEFNEQMDGIIYATAAALGFATLENVFYILDEGAFIILLRGPVSTLGHILFSAMWGAALGLSRFELNKNRRWQIIARGLLLAILTHGAFDVLISLGKFFPEQSWLSLLVLPFLALLYYMVSRQIAHALNVSSFNPGNVLQHLKEGHSRQLEPRSDNPVPPAPRYAPNPNAYQFRNGQAINPVKVKAETQPCPDCGRDNLLDRANNDKAECYNCGTELNK